MTSPIKWVTTKKLTEISGISRQSIENSIDTGEVRISKGSKRKNSQLMIHVDSFNKYWDNRVEIKGN